jgi:hypothetical protein
MKALLLFIATAPFTLLSGNWINARFSIWTRSIPVDFPHAKLEGGGIYRVRLTVPVDQNRIFSSQIQLFDADKDKFSHTPKAKSLPTPGQGLFTVDKKHSLLIAQPASRVALPAKGEGVLKSPLVLPSWLIGSAFFLLGTSSFALLCSVPFQTWKIKVLAGRLVALAAWCLRMPGRHPLVALSLPSTYMLLVYPPLWKDADALTQLILPAEVGNICHFPALYCFGARWIVSVGDCLSTWRLPDLFSLQKPTLPGIYTLVIAQHFALVLSLSLLCKTLTKREGLRGVFVLWFCFASSLYANAQLCGSEAWSICATIFLFVFGLRLYSEGSRRIDWVGYGLSLTLAIGSRHINLLLGFWLIGLFLIIAIARIGSGQQSGLPSRPLLKAGLAAVLLSVAMFSNGFLRFCIATRVGVVPRTTLGRTLSDRIDSFLTQIRPAEAARLSQQLAATTSDHNVRLAIQDQATIGSFYKGTNLMLEKQLQAEGFSGEHLQAEKDRVMLKAALIYLETLHPVLLRVIWKDFLRGFTEVNNVNLMREPFAKNSGVSCYRLDDPQLWAPLNALPSTFLPESIAWFDRSGTDPHLKGLSMKGLKCPQLIAALSITLLFLGLCFWSRRGVWSRAIPALTILLTGTGTFAATMICVYFMPRYALPLWLSVLIAVCLAIDGLFETTKRPEKKESEEGNRPRHSFAALRCLTPRLFRFHSSLIS